jgi:hypothetical protein
MAQFGKRKCVTSSFICDKYYFGNEKILRSDF